MCFEKETIFVTSDLHFSDEKVRKIQRPQFETCEQMNNYIITRWNKKVKKDDVVWVLGDIGTKEGCKNVLKLNGHKKMIMGNHDAELFLNDDKTVNYEKAKEFYLKCGFDEVFTYPVYFNERVLLSHEPQKIDQEYTINIHGHLHKKTIALKDYFNICLDNTMMSPVKIKDYTRFASQKKCVRKEYGKEWYYDLYQG